MSGMPPSEGAQLVKPLCDINININIEQLQHLCVKNKAAPATAHEIARRLVCAKMHAGRWVFSIYLYTGSSFRFPPTCICCLFEFLYLYLTELGLQAQPFDQFRFNRSGARVALVYDRSLQCTMYHILMQPASCMCAAGWCKSCDRCTAPCTHATSLSRVCCRRVQIM